MSKTLFENELVEVTERDGELWFGGILATRRDLDGLRAWFQAERDREIGRDRDPESPDWVVYPQSYYDDVRVLNELDGRSFILSEDGPLTGAVFAEVACRWFAAHPKHRAWHDARPGEAWVIEEGGVERVATVIRYGSGSAFSWVVNGGAVHSNVPTTADGITAGRRVWAPDDGDDDE